MRRHAGLPAEAPGPNVRPHLNQAPGGWMVVVYIIMLCLFLFAGAAGLWVYAKHRRVADGWLGAAALTYAIFPVTQLLGRGLMVGAMAIVIALACMIISLRIRLREMNRTTPKDGAPAGE